MNADQIPDRTWAAIAAGTVSPNCEFLGLSLFITNVKQKYRGQPIAPAQAAAEFRQFFSKYGQLPSAQRDLAKIAHL